MVPYFNKSKSFGKNKSERFLGIEIEIAYIQDEAPLDKPIRDWHGDLGSDSSIESERPFNEEEDDKFQLNPCGLELRTSPTNGDAFIEQMLAYGAAFDKAQAKANASCGLHVHIDGRDLTNLDLDKILMLWSKIEKHLFALVAPSRKEAEWCHPWNFASSLKKIRASIQNEDTYEANEATNYCCQSCNGGLSRDQWISKINKDKKRSSASKIFKQIKDGTIYLERYQSLNLAALQKQNTLENRMHHGTTNVDNIINWALTNASIVDFAKKTSLAALQKLPRRFETLLSVMPTDAIRDWAVARKENWRKRPVETLYTEQIDDRKWFTS